VRLDTAMNKASERLKLWWERLKTEGKRPTILWLNQETAKRLDSLSSSLGVSHAEAIARALGSVTDTVTDTEARVTDAVQQEIAEALKQITDTITATVRESVQEALQPVAVTVADTERPAASTVSVTHPHGTDTNEAVRDIVRRWREKAKRGPRWVHVSELLDELEQAVSVR
jgi:paraquat-inducible protein B